MGMFRDQKNKMFSSRTHKEKDEDDDDDDMEIATHRKPNFNLENILSQSDAVDSGSAAAFRSGPSSLYKGSHRRRRTAANSSSPEDNDFSNGGGRGGGGGGGGSRYHRSSDGMYYDDDDRAVLHHSHRSPYDSRFVDLLARNFKIPFVVLLLILVFWGPMLMQYGGGAGDRAGRRARSLYGVFTPAERDDPEYARLIDKSGEHRGKHGREFAELDPEHDLQYEKNQERKLSNPVLNALRAVQNTDFKLPPRKPESEELEDDKFRPENLSEDEQEELQIQVRMQGKPKASRQEEDQQQLQQKKLQQLELQLELQRQQLQQQQQQQLQQQQLQQQQQQQQQQLQQQRPALSSLQQYQLRTRQEEQQQLKRYQDRQQVPPQQNVQLEPHRIPQQPILPQWGAQQQQQTAQKWQPPQGNQEQVQEQWQPPPVPQQQVQQVQIQKQWQPPPPQQPARIFNYKHADRPDLIPEHFKASFSNVWDPPSQSDTALFWHIPKNGGTTVADILTHCVSLVTASSIGASEGHGLENDLQVRTYHDKGRYVNVNTASIPGIKHAKELGLAASGLAEVVVVHRLHEGSELFDQYHKARVFAMFRNPVHRAISMFYYLQKAQWEPTFDPTLSQMTLEQYANSNKVEENWVTRFLVHRYTGPLSPQDLEQAKQVMRDKMIVGLLDDFQTSLKRFELYFDWWGNTKQKGNVARMVQCQQNHERNVQNKISHPMPAENDPGYKRLLQLNWADMQLYEYAKQLFKEQGELVQHKDASML